MVNVSLRLEVISPPLGFGARLTSGDSLRMRSDVDEIIFLEEAQKSAFKNFTRQCGQGLSLVLRHCNEGAQKNKELQPENWDWTQPLRILEASSAPLAIRF